MASHWQANLPSPPLSNNHQGPLPGPPPLPGTYALPPPAGYPVVSTYADPYFHASTSTSSPQPSLGGHPHYLQQPQHQHPIPPTTVVIQQPNYHSPMKLPTNSPISPGSLPPGPHTPQGPGPVGSPLFSPPPGVVNGPPLQHPLQHQQPPNVNHEHDLHPELLAVGWRKFWSKRENRWYFWNCNNNESMWELPPLPSGRPHPPLHHPHHPDQISDPLGINGPHHLKRRASSGEHLHGGSPAKKYILAGPWDLEVTSNVYTSIAPIPCPHILPVHPETELLRYQLVVKLRQCYQQACQGRESIDAPKESLNRWFLERKVLELRGIDPIFPSCSEEHGESGEVSQLMYKEIMNDVPMKMVKPRFTGDARKQLTKYADACQRIIETRTATNEARKLVKWKINETLSWLKQVVGSSYEQLQERLNHLKETCEPHVHAAAKSSVEGICKKMSSLSKQYGIQCREAHLKHFVDPETILNSPYEPESGRFRCHPVICGSYHWNETGKLPHIDFHQQDRDKIILKYKNDPLRITSQYLQKLEQLYRYNCVDDKKFEFFLARCYSVIKRYNAYTEDFHSPQSTQASLPMPVMETLGRNFGVTFECFSSPLNCYFRQYCSAFPDSDGYFGSRGTFLEFKPVAGSFEFSPPFCEELIDASINHVEELLGGSREPMSFIIFLPEYTEESKDSSVPTVDLECQWIKKLENSRWKRRSITIPAFEHEFRHGALHNLPKSEINIRSTHSTVVFWLQNDAGHEEWKPTEQKVDALIDAYRCGRERERDRQTLLAPERQNPHKEDKILAAQIVQPQMVPTTTSIIVPTPQIP